MKINLKLFWKWSCFAKSLLSFQSCPWELHFRFMLRKKQILSRHCLVQKNRTIHLTLEGHHWKTKTLLMHFTHFMFCRSQFLCFLLSIMIILHKTWNHQVTKYRFCKENTLLNAVTVLAMWDKAMRKLSWEWSGERERIGLRKTLLSFCFTRFLTVTLQLKLSLCVCDSWTDSDKQNGCACTSLQLWLQLRWEIPILLLWFSFLFWGFWRTVLGLDLLHLNMKEFGHCDPLIMEIECEIARPLSVE